MRALISAAVVGLLLVSTVGCDSEPAEPASSPAAESDVPPPLVPAMPLPENAVDDAVAELDGLVEKVMNASGIPGMAVAVVHGGKTVYAKGFGVKDVNAGDGDGNKVNPDTTFQLASLSKPIAATVVARQVGKGAVGWDTPIVEKLPGFALSDPAVTRMVTVGDMMSHRSGLPDHAGDQLEDLGYSREYILDKLRQLPLDPFRISYAYTNFGYTAGAEAVAAAASRKWEDLADEAIFDPLGMGSTSYRFADYEARPNRAAGHIHIDGRYEPLYVRDADPEAPAGGASSSVNDMARWLAMVLADGKHNGTELIDPKALLPALTPQVVSSPASEPAMRTGFYGYGFNVGTTSGARTELSHSGAFESGAGTNFLFLPSADVGIIALTNATPAGVPEALTAEFADLVQFGEVREDWYRLYNTIFQQMEKPVGELVGKERPAGAKPPGPPSSYAGVYSNQYWGPVTVIEQSGKLRLKMGTKLDVELTPWDGNVFSYSWVSENSPPGTVSAATFDGDKLTLDYYDEVGNGVFSR
ncbi:serine hydrolase [Mycobacterium manitobense]|uniref:Serine hydrolase n=1 Tax=[Mycobacterium] manitobense TaxID=190147 RepID=A0A9X2Y643_9MYCO|nr:serine hydrolase domain-containing protein [[Mycobacterium] manitobense]MCV7168622.1 serine hydrolase [[Mycobacterium] manitobense]